MKSLTILAFILLSIIAVSSALPSHNDQLEKRTYPCLHKRNVLGKRTEERRCPCALAESIFDGTSGPVKGLMVYAQDECGSTTITGLFSSGFEDTTKNYTFSIVDFCGKVIRDLTDDLNIEFSEGGSKAFKSKVDFNLNCDKEGILFTENSKPGLNKRTCNAFSKRQADPNKPPNVFMRINEAGDNYAQADIFEL
ncbi:7771_t:CDS:1 [Funneliformis mosseae]|uniref:7771_t:CDS:1 n=1 Tax=Funneliformis mosseae TaxID=27381 RepID=A0A9N8ZPF9_FUNMO|nr:7771_t:CDS:1 [Funneliformis mosseae]